MDVVLATMDEPLYLPRYLDPVLSAHADAIGDVLIVPPARSRIREGVRYARMLGARGLLSLGVPFAVGALAAALPDRLELRAFGRRHSVRDVARAAGVPVRDVSDAADPSFHRWVGDRDPDVILSVVCGQRLPRPVLDVPMHAINVHGSLLPRYRGRATAFWPLYYGDDEAGVTAHEMTATFDAGPIIEQRRFPIGPDDTMHDVALAIARTGAALVVDLLDADLDALGRRGNPTTPDDYHTLPSAEERRAFLARGNAFR